MDPLGKISLKNNKKDISMALLYDGLYVYADN